MSDRYYEYEAYSNRAFLISALIEDTKNNNERILLSQYHAIIKHIKEDEKLLCDVTTVYRGTQITSDTKLAIDSILSRICTNEKSLFELEKTQPIQDILERERKNYKQKIKSLDAQRAYEDQLEEVYASIDKILQKYEKNKQYIEAYEEQQRIEKRNIEECKKWALIIVGVALIVLAIAALINNALTKGNSSSPIGIGIMLIIAGIYCINRGIKL